MFVTEVHSQKTLIPTDFFKNFKEIYKWYKNQGGVRGSILSPYDPKITSKTSILDFKGVDSSEREDLFGLGEVSKRQQYLWNAF